MWLAYQVHPLRQHPVSYQVLIPHHLDCMFIPSLWKLLEQSLTMKGGWNNFQDLNELWHRMCPISKSWRHCGSSPQVNLRSPVLGTILPFVFRIHVIISSVSFLVGPRYLPRTSCMSVNCWLSSQEYTHSYHLYWQIFEMSPSVPKVFLWVLCPWSWNIFFAVMLNIRAFNSVA